MKYNKLIYAWIFLFFTSPALAQPVAGDANDDGTLNVADPVYLGNYLFKGGPALACEQTGDSNGDGAVNISDMAHLASYVFGKRGDIHKPYSCDEPGAQRGDVNLDHQVTLEDADIIINNYLHGDGSLVVCAEALDVNDDGIIGVSDAFEIQDRILQGLPLDFEVVAQSSC